VEEVVTIGVTDPLLRLRTPQNARVNIEVLPTPSEWTVSKIPVSVRNASRMVALTPATVNAVVRGPNDLAGGSAEAFEAYVDAGELKNGQSMLRVRVVAPERVAVVRIEPEQVRARVR
jgi:hypothetical protein